jgi:hypothetical protein
MCNDSGREKLTSFCWDVPYLPITTSTEPNNSSEMKLLVLVTNKSTEKYIDRVVNVL